MNVKRLGITITLLIGILINCHGINTETYSPKNAKPYYYWKLSLLIDHANNAKNIFQLSSIWKEIELTITQGNFNYCPDPKESDFKSLCADITTKTKVFGSATDTVEYRYEQRLWQLACANMGVDDMETAKRKIQAWWNKYKSKCKCDSVNFTVPNGNLLKFSINQSMPDFIDTLVSNYGLDINFIDPADGKNVLDYLNDEIARFKKGGISSNSIKIYEEYRLSLIRLGARTSK